MRKLFKKKNKNYLYPISIILILFLVFLIFSLGIFAAQINNAKNLTLKRLWAQKQEQDRLISDNLVSFMKDDRKLTPEINDASPIRGKQNAPIAIFEFSGFNCEYSRTIEPIITGLMKKYEGKIKLIWKDMPIFGDAEENLKHQAARCAQEQGKFWEYHDLLFSNKNRFDEKAAAQLAENLKLDKNKFHDCLKNNKYAEAIQSDLSEADDLLIPGSPHFYINQQELIGLITEADFEKAIQAELLKIKK